MPTRKASNTGIRNASRANASARANIINMLFEDHRRAKKAFRDFERMKDDDPQACESLAHRTCTELEVHADLEEQLFYPVARRALADAGLIDEAEVEHMSMKVLIEQLKGMAIGDDKFCALFTVLGEYVKHHVKAEEGEMFKQLSRAKVDWLALLGQMQSARAALMRKRQPDVVVFASSQAIDVAALVGDPGEPAECPDPEARPGD